MECSGPQKKSNQVILHLIRHGYAAHNQANDALGSRAYYSNKYRFSQLVEKGKEQALALRVLIENSNMKIDRIYTSPLDRAMQTASILFPRDSKYDRTKIFVTDDIRELGYSHPCNERKSLNILSLAYPNFDYSKMTYHKDVMFLSGDVKNRFISIIDEIRDFVDKWYLDGNTDMPSIVLVSHGSFLLELMRDFLKVDVNSFENCEMKTLKVDLNDL